MARAAWLCSEAPLSWPSHFFFSPLEPGHSWCKKEALTDGKCLLSISGEIRRQNPLPLGTFQSQAPNTFSNTCVLCDSELSKVELKPRV